MVPLLSTAEQLPFRDASLDLVTAFNCVHHFDLGRFLTSVAQVLAPGGQLFIYTRTPQQNARTIWGRYFPGFTEHEHRLHSQAAIRHAVKRTGVLKESQHKPSELMMGKLLGNTGIALVTASLYLAGGYAVAAYHGYADVVSPWILACLGLYLVLAIMLYGSLYMAVGAACNDLKEAQSLMMPVVLMSMFPVFVWTAVLQNPSSALSVGMSLFPPASPFLMLMRLALRPAPPAWQVGLSVILTTASAILCIWAAGKIFRIGLADARQNAKFPRAGSLGDGPVARTGDFSVDPKQGPMPTVQSCG